MVAPVRRTRNRAPFTALGRDDARIGFELEVWASNRAKPRLSPRSSAGSANSADGDQPHTRTRASASHGDIAYYFCSPSCRDCFERDPDDYLGKPLLAFSPRDG
ncbi:MAG: YHS domain-containing protein [Gammaproteobacteria bacterium]|nr:YHS domain-containing protein [Gammaproteobacteria bacterium]